MYERVVLVFVIVLYLMYYIGEMFNSFYSLVAVLFAICILHDLAQGRHVCNL